MAVAVAPAAPTGPQGKAWIIRGQTNQTLAGVHFCADVEETGSSHVLAFRKQQQAMKFCALIGRYKNAERRWPDLTLRADRPKQDITTKLHSWWVKHSQALAAHSDICDELEVKQIDLGGAFTEHLLLNGVALAVINEVVDDDMNVTVCRCTLPIALYRHNLQQLFHTGCN